MNAARFPRRRPDGSFRIAVTFTTSSDGAATAAADSISTWAQRQADDDPLGFGSDFSGVPQIAREGPRQIAVAFDGRPGSQRWKDRLVRFIQEVLADSEGISFSGFGDLIADNEHPT